MIENRVTQAQLLAIRAELENQCVTLQAATPSPDKSSARVRQMDEVTLTERLAFFDELIALDHDFDLSLLDEMIGRVMHRALVVQRTFVENIKTQARYEELLMLRLRALGVDNIDDEATLFQHLIARLEVLYREKLTLSQFREADGVTDAIDFLKSVKRKRGKQQLIWTADGEIALLKHIVEELMLLSDEFDDALESAEALGVSDAIAVVQEVQIERERHYAKTSVAPAHANTITFSDVADLRAQLEAHRGDDMPHIEVLHAFAEDLSERDITTQVSGSVVLMNPHPIDGISRVSVTVHDFDALAYSLAALSAQNHPDIFVEPQLRELARLAHQMHASAAKTGEHGVSVKAQLTLQFEVESAEEEIDDVTSD